MGRGYWVDVKWICTLGNTFWGIQEVCSSSKLAPCLAGTPECSYQCFSSFSMQEQTFFVSSRFNALRWQSHDSHHYLQKSTAQRSPLCLRQTALLYSPDLMATGHVYEADEKTKTSCCDMPSQMKMGFVTKQNQTKPKITWVVFNSFTNGLKKFTLFFLIDISLCLVDLQFVWKQLQVIVNDSMHSCSWNIDFLRQWSCRLPWWFFKKLPYFINISICYNRIIEKFEESHNIISYQIDETLK